MMTRKHFVLLAGAIKEGRARAVFESKVAAQVADFTTRGIVDELCAVLARENPQFDAERFRVAALGK